MAMSQIISQNGIASVSHLSYVPGPAPVMTRNPEALIPTTHSFDTLLVELHEAQNQFGHRSHAEQSLARARVVEAVAALANAALTAEERDLVSDILLSLVRQAELDLRMSLSERLCAMDGVPEDLILFLAHDVIPVARPVLRYSELLTETDLLYIIQSKSAEYWQAIAQRRLLNETVVSALVEKRDEKTAHCLLLNERICFENSAMGIFSELSKYSTRLAEPLLARPEISQSIAMSMFWHVSQELRTDILKRFNIPKATLDAALGDALNDFSGAPFAPALELYPTPLMIDLARQYKRLSRITDTILIKTLRRGQIRFFMALFSERTGLDYDTIHELLRQKGGQGMAVACRAIGVTKENFVSLFMISRTMVRSDDVIDAAELRKAIRYFDALTQVMATRILTGKIHG